MIAVVTGSSGFIGSHLVRHLLSSGTTVRALVRPQSSHETRVPRVEYHEADLLHAEAIAQSTVWSGATHLFHLAGVTKANNLAQFLRGNVQPLANILATLSARRKPPRVVVVSSQAAAGPARSREQPVRESDAATPIESYGISKREAELIAASHTDRVAITVIRPPAVYGPGDTDFRAAFHQAASSLALHAVNPEHWFDLVYVTDVIRALELAATNPEAIGQTYFLSADVPTTWRDFYNLVASVAGSKPRHIQVPSLLLRAAALLGDAYGFVTQRTPLVNSQKLSLANPRYWLCSSQIIRDQLGWRPLVPPLEGVRNTYVWYKRR